MKRVGNLYELMYTTEIALKVVAGVMKDKKYKNVPGSRSFMIMQNLEYYMREYGRILEEHSFKPRKPKESIRYDAGSGKERHIQAPVIFPDQFVHWGVILVLEDVFLKGMDKWCCASVKGRGTLYAKNFLERELDNSNNEVKGSNDRPENKYRYCLKMDIRKFFQNIDRDILMKKLESKIKDKDLLLLIHQIVYSVPGTGLPLGYYTSQWFANFYLQEFDHYLREVLFPKYGVHVYIRYMDDMVILGSNKRKLKRLMIEIEQYIGIKLHLQLKNTSCIFSIAERDIDFIGYRFSYGKTTLRKKILHHARAANRKLYSGKYTLKNVRSAMAYNGWMKCTDTKQYREEFFEGTTEEDIKILKRLTAQHTANYYESEEYAKIQDIKDRMERLRADTELGDGNVLIRYYPNSDNIKVVSRTRYIFPDEEEYFNKKRLSEEERLRLKKERIKERRKRRRKKQNKGNYYASAERYFAEEGRSEAYTEAYNQDIADYDAYRDRQNTKDDWHNTK